MAFRASILRISRTILARNAESALGLLGRLGISSGIIVSLILPTKHANLGKSFGHSPNGDGAPVSERAMFPIPTGIASHQICFTDRRGDPHGLATPMRCGEFHGATAFYGHTRNHIPEPMFVNMSLHTFGIFPKRIICDDDLIRLKAVPGFETGGP